MSYDNHDVCINRNVCNVIHGWSLKNTNINFNNTPYTAKKDDTIILVDATLGPVDVILNKFVGFPNPSYIIKKIDNTANPVSIYPSVGSTINNNASFILNKPIETTQFVYNSDTTDWVLIQNNLEELITDKGDIITHNGFYPVRFPVGIDGQVLMADSSTAEGLIWSSTGGGGGEVNTGSNVGIGTGQIYKTKVATLLEFKTLLAGIDTEIVNNTDEVLINVKPSFETINTSALTVPNPDVTVSDLLITTTTGVSGTIISDTLNNPVTPFIGQRKIITLSSRTGLDKYQLNIPSLVNGTGLLFDSQGDSANLIWTSNGWAILSTNGALLIGTITAPKQLASYQLVSLEVQAHSTDWHTVAYFPWLNSRYNNFINGIVIFHTIITNRNLDIRLVDTTSVVILGSILGLSSSGSNSFNINIPSINSILELQIRKNNSGGNNPRLLGINLEFEIS